MRNKKSTLPGPVYGHIFSLSYLDQSVRLLATNDIAAL